MKNWRIPVVWQETAIVNVVADTLTEAMELARDSEGIIPLPEDSSYIEDSWELATDDKQAIRAYYNGGQKDA